MMLRMLSEKLGRRWREVKDEKAEMSSEPSGIPSVYVERQVYIDSSRTRRMHGFNMHRLPFSLVDRSTPAGRSRDEWGWRAARPASPPCIRCEA